MAGRPNKNEAIAIQKRDEQIVAMDQKGYPLDYIASFHNLTKGRVVQILKAERKKVEAKERTGSGSP